jgi:hypothetical protein
MSTIRGAFDRGTWYRGTSRGPGPTGMTCQASLASSNRPFGEKGHEVSRFVSPFLSQLSSAGSLRLRGSWSFFTVLFTFHRVSLIPGDTARWALNFPLVALLQRLLPFVLFRHARFTPFNNSHHIPRPRPVRGPLKYTTRHAPFPTGIDNTRHYGLRKRQARCRLRRRRGRCPQATQHPRHSADRRSPRPAAPTRRQEEGKEGLRSLPLVIHTTCRRLSHCQWAAPLHGLRKYLLGTVCSAANRVLSSRRLPSSTFSASGNGSLPRSSSPPSHSSRGFTRLASLPS